MKQLDLKKHRYWLLLSGVWMLSSLILAVCYFTLHLPVKGQLMQLGHQADESRDTLTIAQRASSPVVREEIQQQLQETRQAVEHYSVPRPQTTSLVFEIGKMANDLGLSEFASQNQPFRDIPTIRDSQTVSEDWLKVQFRSGFSEFAQFVNRLERQTPAVFIERLTVRRSEDGRQQHDVKMELSFIVTHDKDNPVAAAPADPTKQP